MVNFIPRYLIAFDAAINRTVFLISLSGSLLSVCNINTNDVHILILYPAKLLNLLVQTVFGGILGFSVNTMSCYLQIVFYWASLVALMANSLPAVQETQVQSLGREDPLGEEMAAHSVFLPEKFRGQKSLMGYSPWGCNELNTTERLNTYIDK